MKITVSTVSDYVFELDVAEDLELENFKAFCEVESGFPSNEIVISFKGRPLLDNKKTLKDCGISEGDVVELQHVMQAAAAAAAASSGGGGQGPSGQYPLYRMIFMWEKTTFILDLSFFSSLRIGL